MGIGGVEQNLLRTLPVLLEDSSFEHELILSHANGELEAKLPVDLNVIHLSNNQRFSELFQLFQETDLAHLYTINRNPLFRTTAFLANLPVVDNVRNLLDVPHPRMVEVLTCASREIGDMQASPEKVKIIPNGLAVPAELQPALEKFSKEHSQSPVLVEIGRANKERRVSAEEFVPPLKEKFSGLTCHILGRQGENRGGLIYHGEVEDPVPYYQQAHFLTHFPDLEPFGMTVLEAYKYGLIPVVSGEGGIRDLVVNGETGYLLEKPDPNLVMEQLSVLLEKFVSGPRFWHQMVEAGLERLKQNYTLERHLEEYKALYRQMAERKDKHQLELPSEWSSEFSRFFEHFAFDKLRITAHNLPHRKFSQPLERDLARLFSAEELMESNPETALSLLQSLETNLDADFWSLRLKNELYDAREEYEKAIDAGEKAIEVNPLNAEVYLAVAHAHLELNQLAEAVSVLQELTERVPDYEPARETLNRLRKIV